MPLLLSQGDLGPRTPRDRTGPLAPDAIPSGPWPLLTAPWAASRVPQPRDLSDPGRNHSRLSGAHGNTGGQARCPSCPRSRGGEDRLKGVTPASWGCISQRGLATGTNIPGLQALNPTQTPPPRSRAGTRDGYPLHAVVPEPRTHFLGSGRLPLDLSIQSVQGKRARLDGAHSTPPPPCPPGPRLALGGRK